MLPGSYSLPVAVLLIVGGALACFAGHRVFRIVLAIYGFILGALVATSVLAPTASWMTPVVALAGGLAGAAALLLAYFVGVAFVGAALGALLVHLIWSWVSGGEPPAVLVLVSCIAGALASMKLQHVVIVAGTAIAGAWTLLAGALLASGVWSAPASKASDWLAYPLNPVSNTPWVTGAWLALAVVGAAVQVLVVKGRPGRGGKRRSR